MSGKLTTHVLDTARGKPAAGLQIDLWRIKDDERIHLGSFKTNDDGRISNPLLKGDNCQTGTYELVFQTGDYQASFDENMGDNPRFLNEIPIRFGLLAGQHYHVPLLLSPFGYSTYRGS